MMLSHRLAMVLIVVFCSPISFQANASPPSARLHITTFEAPGAGVNATRPSPPMQIGNNHGYIRARDGRFTQIDHPLAASGFEQGTSVIGINDDGTISGYYVDANNVYHGFVRRPESSFETFDAPGADASAFDGTICMGINIWGSVTGTAYNSTSGHGFVRSRSGTIMSFDPPGSVLTVPFSINAAGTVTGYYVDRSGAYHGFLRTGGGIITTIDPPGSVYTVPESLNDLGSITGSYVDATGVGYGFIRYHDGTITKFGVPNSVFVEAVGINDAGAVTGAYGDVKGSHGFIRAANGTFTSFDVPGDSPIPLSINLWGQVTGIASDATNLNYGFIYTP